MAATQSRARRLDLQSEIVFCGWCWKLQNTHTRRRSSEILVRAAAASVAEGFGRDDWRTTYLVLAYPLSSLLALTPYDKVPTDTRKPA